MREIDPGHLYELDELDGGEGTSLRFVKREGERYPGNMSSYTGTTTQEVLRALIARMEYVDGQEGHPRNGMVVRHLRLALYQLETRHAEMVGMRESFKQLMEHAAIESIPTCPTCGHIVCHHREPKG